MSSKKQTAVEFLAIELINKSENDYSYAQAHKIITIDLDSFYQLVEKSLAMEKEQMIQSFRKGAVVNEPEYYTWIESGYRKQAEKYYNETYS